MQHTSSENSHCILWAHISDTDTVLNLPDEAFAELCLFGFLSQRIPNLNKLQLSEASE